MTYELFLALLGFAFVTSVTPGPNNMMLLASGVNFGFRRTVPHMLGISIGHSLMVFLVGLGLAGVFKAWPPALVMLKVASVAYMLWLAWKIANSGPIRDGEARGRPLTFLQAALFQWVNPKAWVMGITAIATYTVTSSYIASVFAVGLVFGLVNIPSISAWVLFGAAMRNFLRNPRHLRVFNVTMALLLVVSMAPLVLG